MDIKKDKKELRDNEILFKNYIDCIPKIISDSFDKVYESNKNYFDVKDKNDFAKNINFDEILFKVQKLTDEMEKDLKNKKEKNQKQTKYEKTIGENKAKCTCDENSECRKTGKCTCYEQANKKKDTSKKYFVVEKPTEIILDKKPKFDISNSNESTNTEKIKNNKEKILNILSDFKEEKEKDDAEVEVNKLLKEYLEIQEEIDKLDEKLNKIIYKILEYKEKEKDCVFIKQSNEIKEKVLDICKPLNCMFFDENITLDEDGKLSNYKIIINTEEEPGNMQWKQYLFLNTYINEYNIPICVALYRNNSIDSLEIKNQKYASILFTKEAKKDDGCKITLTKEHDSGNIITVSNNYKTYSVEKQKEITKLIHKICEKLSKGTLVII